MSRKELWANLQKHDAELSKTHLRDLLADKERNKHLIFEHDNIVLDLTHEKITDQTLNLLEEVAVKSGVYEGVKKMFSGEKINTTEGRAVLHVALRAQKGEKIVTDGKNVVEEVHETLHRIENFSNQIRSGHLKGKTGRTLKNVVVIGIGGSYLSIEFVYEALRSHPEAVARAQDRKLRFLANVDPIDFSRATEGLCVEETLFIINSKTFTTAETMLNARTCRNWLIEQYKLKGVVCKNEDEIKDLVNHHMCAASTNLTDTSKFGISAEKVFGFWDWVGGRYSVWSAVGILPLSIQFGYDYMDRFLKGAHNIDTHLAKATSIKGNLPLLLALVGFYNTSIKNLNARAILPYCQALCKFVPHVQQLDMESNGKRVNLAGQTLDYECTVVNFGEPGTNGQHSFYQLLHQGRIVPCEFIGFCRSQRPVVLAGEPVTSHEELMSNFFSQPDALACGKTIEELKAEKVPENLQNHKYFPGDRPSLSLLFTELNPYTAGQLLALYEHRTAIEGFLWDINSFDQWGVELGKVLAKQVRTFFQNHQDKSTADFSGTKFNSATEALLSKFVQHK
ncbi:glucose-6-phosphate isomerase (macronuclear) [Tetrahymena thermophila SB210]|uniref:Glucose-6-phosphate isomerase n=1 Tax=Tetrahymena thermophila (strain SB210) TaxID=312017 RepID=Q22B85_TETTS|nr:glucose-6-phosphate isomerase [Tetrahymena thermophila SB210]EAR82568.2 glucose-6-phosphate isomerase [Tetrahymena thermophila SB210]|eukprot:XP_001030231.2 glucose-6-phosphate isomerase [Tetrahymena thermophila SB210]